MGGLYNAQGECLAHGSDVYIIKMSILFGRTDLGMIEVLFTCIESVTCIHHVHI